MAAYVQCRPHEMSFGMVMKEVDEDLAMFLEMRNHENGSKDFCSTEKMDDSSDSNHDGSLLLDTVPSVTTDDPDDNYLNLENDRSDYGWLLAPPGTPICSPMELEEANSVERQTEISNSQLNLSKPEAAKSPEESASLHDKSVDPPVSTGVNSTTGNRRPSSSGGKKSNVSRPATPTGRPSLPAISKSARSSTPTSRTKLPSAPVRSSTPTSRATTKTVAPPVRSSTPTSRATARSSTPTARSSVAPPARSSTPAKGTARSSTPTARSSVPASKPGSRSTTPTRKINNPSLAKTGPTMMKDSVPSRGLSPTVKSRPSKPSELPAASLAKRPSSASRVRPSVPSARSSSTDTCSNGKPRQQAFPSSMGRAPNGRFNNIGSAMLSKSRGHSDDSDYVNPVLIGTEMVERVVNMRKLAPPKQDEHLSCGKSSSSTAENSGFGRSLSKKSLDMAIRHMDITRRIAADLRPIVTGGSAFSSKVRSGSMKSKTSSVSDSPLATSSNAGSEPSINDNSRGMNGREDDENDMGSERGHYAPTCQQDP